MNWNPFRAAIPWLTPPSVSAACLFFLVVTLVFTSEPPGFAGNAASAGNLPAASQQPANEGRQLFESVCAGCHGLDGKGGERGPDISTRQQIVQLSDREILEILRGGRPAAGMPPFDYLGSAKLKELLGYLRTLQGKGSQVALPGNAANGKVLFFGKARCSECHMVQGTGGFLGRDLSAYGATLSPVEIRSNILKTSSASNRANQTAVVTMRDAHEFKGVIRNEDNFSIQLQSFDGAFHFLTTADVAHVDFLPEPIMPANYDKTLTSPELDDLVSYLATVSRVGRGGKNFKEEDDD